MIFYTGECGQEYIYRSDDDFMVCGCHYEYDSTTDRYYYYDSSKNWRRDRDVRRRISKKAFFAELVELQIFFRKKAGFVEIYEPSVQNYKCLRAANQ